MSQTFKSGRHNQLFAVRRRKTQSHAAYKRIDKGVKLNKQQPGAGDEKIKQGTAQLIDFEQKVVLQPIFDEYANTVRLITPAIFGDLDADDTKTDPKTFAPFNELRANVAAPAFGEPVILSTTTNFGTSFGNADARVNWINDKVFPKRDEQRAQRFDEVKRQMQKIVERADAPESNLCAREKQSESDKL